MIIAGEYSFNNGKRFQFIAVIGNKKKESDLWHSFVWAGLLVNPVSHGRISVTCQSSPKASRIGSM